MYVFLNLSTVRMMPYVPPILKYWKVAGFGRLNAVPYFRCDPVLSSLSVCHFAALYAVVEQLLLLIRFAANSVMKACSLNFTVTFSDGHISWLLSVDF